jgi:hypothetical protein
MGDSGNPFIIRTPWQMQNISSLNYTIPNPPLGETGALPGRLFIQERNIDFLSDRGFSSLPVLTLQQRRGDGTFANLDDRNAVVQGVFNHVYRGADFEVRTFEIDFTATAANSGIGVGLFSRIGSGDGNVDRVGRVENLSLVNSIITGTGPAIVGGLAGINDGIIELCRVEEVDVTGTNSVGGMTGINDGIIKLCRVEEVTVTGTNGVGGMTGLNDDLIELCIVRNVLVTGIENVGGYAGMNSADGTIRQSGFEDTAPTPAVGTLRAQSVVGTNSAINTVGGFAGTNAGLIENVYFLSMARLSDPPPVSNNGGGIVGYNDGVVTYAFYYAPAPYSQGIAGETGTPTIIYPIVRDGALAAMKSIVIGDDVTPCGIQIYT